MKADHLLDRRIRRTRRALRQTLQDLLGEKQFEQITVREIAERADISYPTFFRHYADKDALLSELMTEEISDLLDQVLPMFTSAGSLDSVTAMCVHVKDKERIWSPLLTGGAAGNVRSTFIAQVEDRAAVWPERTDWLPAEIGTQLLCSVTLDVLSWWLGKAQSTSISDVATILARFFSVVEPSKSIAKRRV